MNIWSQLRAYRHCEHLERKQKDEGHIITHGAEVPHEVGVEDNMRVIVNKESTQLNHFFRHPWTSTDKSTIYALLNAVILLSSPSYLGDCVDTRI